MSYPKFLYHRDFEPMLVKNAEQEKKLGAEWKDTPAAFEGHVESCPEVTAAQTDPTKPRMKKKDKA